VGGAELVGDRIDFISFCCERIGWFGCLSCLKGEGRRKTLDGARFCKGFDI